MDKTYISEAIVSLREIAIGLTPGALGAAVSVATQTGLTWLQRFLQLTVGIIVSYYAGEIAEAVFGLPEMVKSGIGFVAGLAAFEVVKNLRTSLGSLALTAPQDLWDNVKSWFGRKQ